MNQKVFINVKFYGYILDYKKMYGKVVYELIIIINDDKIIIDIV